MRGQAGDALATLQQSIHRAERFFDDLLHAHEAAADPLFGKLEDCSFSVIQDFFSGIALIRGARNGGVGGVNQPAQQRLVADDLYVVLDARTVRNAVDQSGDVADVANRLQFLALIEFFDQRNHVDRSRGLGQIDHAGEDAAMRIEREVLRLQMLGGFVVGKIVEQDRAQDGALGFNVRRKRVRETVIGSCQSFLTFQEKLFKKARAILLTKPLWMRSNIFGKRRTNPNNSGCPVARKK